MAIPLRVATFNLENLDDDAEAKPLLEARIEVLCFNASAAMCSACRRCTARRSAASASARSCAACSRGRLRRSSPTPIEGQGPEHYRWKSAAGWAEGFFLSSMKLVEHFEWHECYDQPDAVVGRFLDLLKVS